MQLQHEGITLVLMSLGHMATRPTPISIISYPYIHPPIINALNPQVSQHLHLLCIQTKASTCAVPS
jgi:hypothetical protein